MSDGIGLGRPSVPGPAEVRLKNFTWKGMQGAISFQDPSHFAERIITLVLRLLPSAARERKFGEFRAEMAELTRREQISYALSMLRGVFALRQGIIAGNGEFRNANE